MIGKIYDPIELSRAKLAIKNAGPQLNPNRPLCTCCKQRKDRKGGKVTISRTGKKLFTCAPCAS